MSTSLRALAVETRIDSRRLHEQAPVIAIWEPPTVQQAKATATHVAIPIERDLIATLESPLRVGETARVGMDRKEHEIAALLERLKPVESLALSKRLSIGADSDPLVIAFGRFVVERRNRLVAYLARRRVTAR